jgi:Flp pilus assembly protein TadG
MAVPKGNERGLSQSVQYAVILPTLMLITLGIIQAGVWIHGHDVAVRAANAAADVARGSYGTTEQARDVAERLAAAGGLRDVQVDVTRAPARVNVTVRAQAPLIFDVGLGRISETASAPVERVTTP